MPHMPPDTASDTRRPRILLVEDEFIIAMFIRRMLENLGFAVDGPFASGEEALEHVAGCEPDLVLLDVKLAGEIDGVETAARLRERSRAKIVFTSAFSDAETKSRAEAVEPDGFLVKPVEEAELYDLMATFFALEAR